MGQVLRPAWPTVRVVEVIARLLGVAASTRKCAVVLPTADSSHRCWFEFEFVPLANPAAATVLEGATALLFDLGRPYPGLPTPDGIT